MKTRLSATVTLWCVRFIALVMLALLFLMPGLIDWYRDFRELGPNSPQAILIGFYCCAPLVFYALWCVDRLTSNILKEAVFIHANVRYIRRIRWCCAGVSLVCLPAAWFYPPLIFLAVIMAFLAVVVSVVKNVLAAAVELREENDLTI